MSLWHSGNFSHTECRESRGTLLLGRKARSKMEVGKSLAVQGDMGVDLSKARVSGKEK